MGRYTEAEALLTEASTLVPDDPYVHATMAMMYAQTQQWAKAIASFKACIARHPEEVDEVRYNLAYTYQNIGNYPAALAEYQKVWSPTSIPLGAHTAVADTTKQYLATGYC